MRNFLRVPQRLHIALMLMVDLAGNYSSGNFMSLKDVAERNGTSQGFLEEVAVLLKGTGLIEAKRGAGGGYRIAADPADISVGDVVTAVEGPLALVQCLGGSSCAVSKECASRMAWVKVQARLEDAMHSISLADLMKQKHEK